MISVTVAMVLLLVVKVEAASCKSNYGGGETCIVNKRFEIEKKVRIEGDDDWEDKITGVKENEVVEFRIRIKNKSDEEAGGFDDMKMTDYLPSEMYRIGGSGLTEYWDDFEAGEREEFIIKAKIDSEEFDRDDNFEKCVVNKAKVEWDDKFEGSDTATVCYEKGDVTVTELPDTGAGSTVALIGAGLLVAGLILKKSINYIA